MDIGLYQSAASLSALERWQDAVSQNIASGEATAYKKRTTSFTAENSGEFLIGPAARIGNGDGQPAQFPLAQTGISFTPGQTHPTGRNLDLALQGQGFFEIQLPDGRHAYTRVGEFNTRADRTITGVGGSELLTDGGNPLQLQPVQGKLTIDHNGAVFQGSTQIGRISVQNFDHPEQLTPISDGVYVAPPGVEPTPVDKPEILQGQLESSNLSSLHEMVDLVTISRAYEANQKMITSRDELLDKVLQTFG